MFLAAQGMGRAASRGRPDALNGPRHEAQTGSTVSTGSSMANHTILLIDYDPRSIESLRTPLVSAGYRVEVAKDGIAGSRRFAELLPDLTLVEAMIPKKHGFEVCQELKSSEHGKNSPVVIITGVYKGRKYRHQARHQYGCDEFLEKPISPTDLLAVVRG